MSKMSELAAEIAALGVAGSGRRPGRSAGARYELLTREGGQAVLLAEGNGLAWADGGAFAAEETAASVDLRAVGADADGLGGADVQAG